MPSPLRALMVQGLRQKISPLLLVLFTGLAVLSPFQTGGAQRFIYAQGLDFIPSELTIDLGDTVIWQVRDASHTVSGAGADPFCGSRQLFAGESCTNTFTAAGNFPYRCIFHGYTGMTGVVHVVNSPNTAPVVSITSPTNGTTLTAPALFTIKATATDAETNLARVEFFAGPDSFSVTNSLGIVTNTAAISNGVFSLTITNPLAFAVGSHLIAARATDTRNASGSSSQSRLTVAPLLSTAAVNTNSLFQFRFRANPGQKFIIQSTSDFTNWTALATNTLASNSFTFQDAAFTNLNRRFYRVIKP